MATDLIDRARAGDEEAFSQLVEPYQRELQVHCYRILGSAQDAEDVVQETLLTAWRSLGGFEQRPAQLALPGSTGSPPTPAASNALRRSASRRPPAEWPNRAITPPEPTRLGEITWLEPYPDVLLNELPDTAPGPQARYEAREAISLAFVTALQLLPPRQRAALILRDVLDFRASEAADILATSEQSVESALKRARATLASRLPPPGQQPPLPHSTRRGRTRRPAHAGVRGRGRRWHRRPAHRRRLADHAADSTAVPGTRAVRTILYPGLPHRPPLPARRDAGQRPRVGMFGLYASDPHAPGPARQRADRDHPGRRADQQDRPLRQQRAPPLRAPPVPTRLNRVAIPCVRGDGRPDRTDDQTEAA